MALNKGISSKRTKARNSPKGRRFQKQKYSGKYRTVSETNDEKLKHESDDNSHMSNDSEEEYEKQPRFRKEVKVRNLLPVKSKDGFLFRTEVVPDETEEVTPVVAEKETKVCKQSLIERYAVERKTVESLKRKVALLCTSIIEDPENNIVALKELVLMLENPSTQMVISEKRILAFSLLQVFFDIIPSYRIRSQEENDPKVKLKKETKKLLGYEQTLLRSYKKYLDLCYEMIRQMRSKKAVAVTSAKKKALREIGLVGVKCMSELLYSCFNFNYFKNICNKLVPLAADNDEEGSIMCCEAFQKLFKADKRGQSSYELVAQIAHVIKERKFCVPISLLRTFLALNLREAKAEVEKIDMRKGRKEWCQMSRTERRNKKRIKDLEAELKEAEAYESVENVTKFHTATLNKIFWVFFHILKDGEKLNLIGPALEGLSKFAYLINLEFFDDLNSVLCGMMESGKLNDVDKLHGVYTLFTILAGQAESLNIDPHNIYCHMYQGLLNLNNFTNVEHYELLLKCLEYNIIRKKRRISSNRILAFTKRVCTVCLQTPVHGTLGLLASLKNIIRNVKVSDILLDAESTLGSGIYLPEIEDPEHCNAQSTALWELHLLRKHYNPVIKLFSQHLLHGCPIEGRQCLPDKLLKSSPEEVLNLFSDVATKNKMDFLEESEEPPKKKFKFQADVESLSSEYDVNLDPNLKELMEVNFYGGC